MEDRGKRIERDNDIKIGDYVLTPQISLVAYGKNKEDLKMVGQIFSIENNYFVVDFQKYKKCFFTNELKKISEKEYNQQIWRIENNKKEPKLL